MKTKFLFIVLIYIASIFPLHAQYADDYVELSSRDTIGGEIKACQKIWLTGEFTFKAAPGKKMVLKLDADICSPYQQTQVNTSEEDNAIIKVIPLDNPEYLDISDSEISVTRGDRILTVVDYYNGLGHLSQTIQAGASPYRADYVSYTDYDAFGRKNREWLPTPVSGNKGAYIDPESFKASARDNYSDEHPYIQPEYDSSPLNRIVKEYNPGESWHLNKKGITRSYKTNSDSDVVLFQMDNDKLSRKGYYEAGQLLCLEIEDEDGKKAVEFRDKLDRLILSRQLDGSVKHDTYYVYDDISNLRCVIPPLGTDGIVKNTETSDITTLAPFLQYGYSYRYDTRQRMIEKKMPGSNELTWYVYDKTDRLRLVQDPAHREKGIWLFTKYDSSGREIMSGTVKSSSGRDQMVDSLNNESQNNEQFQDQSFYNYSWNSYPANDQSTTIHAAYYYDNYDFLNNLADNSKKTTLSYVNHKDYDSEYDQDASLTKGLLTARRTHAINRWNTEMIEILYYDKKGRVVQSRSTNILGGYDFNYRTYSFAGELTKSLTQHYSGSITSTPTLAEEYFYDYDHAGRLTKTSYKVNNGPLTEQSALAYDRFGRIRRKKINEEHIINYQYNLRGWITKINNPLFSEHLDYEKPQFGATPNYNGNISSMSYKMAGSSETRGYKYTYDELNRLKNGLFYKNGSLSEGLKEEMEYDKQGNITSLVRTTYLNSNENNSIENNNLSFSYDGNRLKKVENAGTPYFPYISRFFVDKAHTETEYLYDANGNMAMDSNKGISNIRYNSLNLPERIQMTQGHIAEYIYDGWGIKRSEVNTTARAGVNVPMTQTMELTGTNLLSKERLVYIDNKIYRSTDDVNYTLIKVNTPEGYLTKSGNNFVTHSYLKDHLGNIRMDIAQGKTIKDGIHYFPFGIEYYRYSSDWGDVSWERFNGKEMKGLFGQNFLDYGARFYDPALGRWQVPDPLAEKYYNVSPYAYCSNNPINRIDPDGRDWFTDIDGSFQFNPNLTLDNQVDLLLEGQSYLGETYQKTNKKGNIIEDYRSDGSIMFANETSAYNRMWSQANEKGVEQSGYALKDGKILVMPDYANESKEVDISNYGYSINKNMTLSHKDGEKLNITGNIHTHQDPSGDATPSRYILHYGGGNYGDLGHSKGMGGLPVIVMGHDGNVYGIYYIKGSEYGNINFKGNGVTRTTLLNGNTKLTPWLSTFPVTTKKK